MLIRLQHLIDHLSHNIAISLKILCYHIKLFIRAYVLLSNILVLPLYLKMLAYSHRSKLDVILVQSILGTAHETGIVFLLHYNTTSVNDAKLKLTRWY